MRRWLTQWVILAVAFVVTVWLLPGITVDWHPGTYLLIAFVFTLVNWIIGPILRLFSLPLTVVTLGLFALVVNALLFEITNWLSDSMHVDRFLDAMLGAIVLSIVTTFVSLVVRPFRRVHAV